MAKPARLGSLGARHLVASALTLVAACLAWTVVYTALLLWALASGGGVGGPLAYPFGFVVVCVLAAAACLLFLLPATVLAERVARRRGLPVLAQIPLSIVALACWCGVIVSIAAATGSVTGSRNVVEVFGALFVALLAPLGLYWWAAQGPALLMASLHRFRRTPLQGETA